MIFLVDFGEAHGAPFALGYSKKKHGAPFRFSVAAASVVKGRRWGNPAGFLRTGAKICAEIRGFAYHSHDRAKATTTAAVLSSFPLATSGRHHESSPPPAKRRKATASVPPCSRTRPGLAALGYARMNFVAMQTLAYIREKSKHCEYRRLNAEIGYSIPVVPQ